MTIKVSNGVYAGENELARSRRQFDISWKKVDQDVSVNFLCPPTQEQDRVESVTSTYLQFVENESPLDLLFLKLNIDELSPGRISNTKVILNKRLVTESQTKLILVF